MSDVLAWDIETAPDLRVFCCCYGLEGESDDEIPNRFFGTVSKRASVLLSLIASVL
jgi:predicted PolB exonuclease-like 3'-5' exonuclease